MRICDDSAIPIGVPFPSKAHGLLASVYLGCGKYRETKHHLAEVS